MNRALSAASQCSIGSDCFIPNWQTVIVRTMERLEADGFCTSFDLDSGDCWEFNIDGSCAKKGLGSEMGIRSGLAKTEFYQPITSARKARWAEPRSVCRPALDEEGLGATRAYLEVGPQPTPTPGPIPTPTPTPTPGACPIVLAADHFLDIRLKRQDGARMKVDATPFYCGFPTPAALSCGTKCCGLGVDGGPVGVACEAELFGVPVWSGPVEPTSNPFTVFVSTGTVTACSSKHPQFCNSVVIP